MNINLGDYDMTAAIGVLTEGPGAITHVLIISWKSETIVRELWPQVKRCNSWRLAARYRSDGATLSLVASGEPIPAGPVYIWHGVEAQTQAIPVFVANWELDNVEGLRFFMWGARRHGCFMLMPAVGGEICQTLPPILARLRRPA
jgi:hypothetical protein